MPEIHSYFRRYFKRYLNRLFYYSFNPVMKDGMNRAFLDDLRGRV